MDKTELQKLIDNKKWDELSNHNILSYFCGQVAFEDIIFDESFILEFCLQDKYYSKSVQAPRLSVGYGMYYDDIWMNLGKQIEAFNLKFTVDEWKKYINNIVDPNELHLQHNAGKWALKLHDKDVNYARALLDDNLWGKIVRYSKNLSSRAFTMPADGMFDGLTHDEKIKIRSRILFSGIFVFTSNSFDVTAFEDFGIDFSDTIEWIEDMTNFKAGRVFANKSQDEIIEIIKDRIDNKYSNYNIINNYLCWFLNNKDVLISAENLNFIFKRFGNTAFPYIIHNMSKDQIIDIFDDIDIETAARSSKMDLETLGDLYNNQLGHLGGNKFFTEEEMSKHPNFFNPNQVKNSLNCYCSRPVFMILNKTWNMNERYSKKLMDFNIISRNIPDYTVEIFGYLKHKTKLSKVEQIEFLKGKFYRSNISKSAKKVKAMGEFLKKFDT